MTPTPGQPLSEADVSLLPCPFCGGEAWLNDYEAKYSDLPPKSRAPQCRSCGASLGYLTTPAKAIAAWNRRPHAPVSRPGDGVEGGGEVEEALSCLADYDHTGRLEKAVRSALRPQPSRQAEAGREAIRKVIHELWQLLDDGETGADGTVTIDQARYQEVSKAMDDLEALVPDSAGPFWGGFPVNYFWSLK